MTVDFAPYLEKAEQHANQASEQMKQHIMNMAKSRQEIHAVLNDEQKQELKRLMDKKMKRMERHDEDD